MSVKAGEYPPLELQYSITYIVQGYSFYPINRRLKETFSERQRIHDLYHNVWYNFRICGVDKNIRSFQKQSPSDVLWKNVFLKML